MMNRSLKVLILFVVSLVISLSTVSAETSPAVFWSYDAGSTLNGVAISDNGNYIAAASDDGYVYFLNKTKNLLWKVQTENRPLKVAISSDGSRVFVGDESTVYLYNKKGDMVWEFYEGDSIQDLATTPGGDRVVAGSLSRYLYLLDGDGNMLWKYKTNAPVLSVAISGDGKLIAAGSSGGTTYLLNKDGKLLWGYSSGRSINGVGILGDRVVSGSRYLNFLEDGEKVGYYTSITCDISSLETTADGEYMLVGCEDGKAHFLDKSKKKLWSYDVGKTSWDSSVSFKGDYAVVAGGNTLYILTPPDRTPPVVEITRPKDGATVSGVVKIGASVVESSPYILKVLIDGNYACSKLPCNWNTGASPQGKHKITVKVTDSAGNAGKDTVSVTLKQTLLQNITDEISEKQEAIKEKGEAVKETEEAVKEKINDALPQNLPPLKEHRDFGPIIKAVLFILAVYVAFRILKTRKSKKYKWKQKGHRR